MNTVSVDKSLLTRVTQYVADRVFDFQQAETAPDGSIEIEAQEIIDSELKLLSELQAALAQPEQPAEQPEAGRDLAAHIAEAIERDLAAHIAEAIEKERFEIVPADLYRRALEEVIRDALKVFRPQAQRDQLRARVEKLEIEREAQRSCAIYWMDQEDALRASIAALAERWDARSAALKSSWTPRDLDNGNLQFGEFTILTTCARELRQLTEGNSAAAQEGL